MLPWLVAVVLILNLALFYWGYQREQSREPLAPDLPQAEYQIELLSDLDVEEWASTGVPADPAQIGADREDKQRIEPVADGAAPGVTPSDLMGAATAPAPGGTSVDAGSAIAPERLVPDPTESGGATGVGSTDAGRAETVPAPSAREAEEDSQSLDPEPQVRPAIAETPGSSPADPARQDPIVDDDTATQPGQDVPAAAAAQDRASEAAGAAGEGAERPVGTTADATSDTTTSEFDETGSHREGSEGVPVDSTRDQRDEGFRRSIPVSPLPSDGGLLPAEPGPPIPGPERASANTG